jgi:hypothetical protein
MKCGNYDGSTGAFCLFLLSFLLTFINWAMALAIVAKVNRLRKKDGDVVGLTNKIKSGIIATIIISSIDLIFIFCQFVLLVLNYQYNMSNSLSKIHSFFNDIHNNKNIQIGTNQPSTNRTSGTIIVREIYDRNSLIRNVIPNEVYDNLKIYVEMGKLLFVKISAFYEEMGFDGLTTLDRISNEILEIIMKLSRITKDGGDPIPETFIGLYLLEKNMDNLHLLVLYLFPLIMMIIKIKIDLGLYKRSAQIDRSKAIVILERMQRAFEKDVNKNIRQTFRYTRQINQYSLENLIRNS